MHFGFALLFEVVVKVLQLQASYTLVIGELCLDADRVRLAYHDAAVAIDGAHRGHDRPWHGAFACNVVQAARRSVFLEGRRYPVCRIISRQRKVDSLQRAAAKLVFHRVDPGPLRPRTDRVCPDRPRELRGVTHTVLGVSGGIFHPHPFAVVAQNTLVRPEHFFSSQLVLFDAGQAFGVAGYHYKLAALEASPLRERVVDPAADPPVVQRDGVLTEVVKLDELVNVFRKI